MLRGGARDPLRVARPDFISNGLGPCRARQAAKLTSDIVPGAVRSYGKRGRAIALGGVSPTSRPRPARSAVASSRAVMKLMSAVAQRIHSFLDDRWVTLPGAAGRERAEFRTWHRTRRDAPLSTNGGGLGFDLLMISDHIAVTPDVAEQYPAPFYEPFTTLAWLAGTGRIRLGTTVLIVPYRHPLLIARMAANLSQGPLRSYWPGAAYVNWVGLDGYYDLPAAEQLPQRVRPHHQGRAPVHP